MGRSGSYQRLVGRRNCSDSTAVASAFVAITLFIVFTASGRLASAQISTSGEVDDVETNRHFHRADTLESRAVKTEKDVDSSSPSKTEVEGHDWYVDNDDRKLWNLSALSRGDVLPEQLPYGIKVLFGVSYCIIIMTAIFFNLLVVGVVASARKLRSSVTNIFFVSLAVSDLLIATVNMPLQLVSQLHDEWTVGGEPLCKLSSYLQGVVVVASILTLAGIAIDRYYAICRPLEARHLHTVRRALCLVAVFWLLAAVVIVPQLFVQRLEPVLVVNLDAARPSSDAAGSHVPWAEVRMAYICVEYFEDWRMNVVYSLMYYFALYLLPLLIMFIAYGRIALTLWRRTPPGEQVVTQPEIGYVTGSTTVVAAAKRLAERKRIVRMLVTIVSLFALSWFPFFTAQIYILFDDVNAIDDVATNALQPEAKRLAEGGASSISTRATVACLQLIAYTNCAINPVVYCLLNDRFQTRLRKMARSLAQLALDCTLISRRRRHRSRRNQPVVRHPTVSEIIPPAALANLGPVTGRAAAERQLNVCSETTPNGGDKSYPDASGTRHVELGRTPYRAAGPSLRSPPSEIHMDLSQAAAHYARDNLAADVDDLSRSRSSSEGEGLFTPSTEELPVAQLFGGEVGTSSATAHNTKLVR